MDTAVENTPGEDALETTFTFGVDLDVWRGASDKERGLIKARWGKKMKAEATELGVDFFWWKSIPEEDREQMRAEGVPEWQKVGAAGSRSAGAAEVRSEDTDDEDVIQVPPATKNGKRGLHPKVQQRAAQGRPIVPPEELPAEDFVYTAGSIIPPEDPDPSRRQHPTIGAIETDSDGADYIGQEREKDPRTFEDIYARWNVGDGQHYLRVVRTKPKVWQGVQIAGELATEYQRIGIPEFTRKYGGGEYEITLYGPHPKGLANPETGEIIVKALTKPFVVTLPGYLPPMLMAPMAQSGERQMNMTDTFLQPNAGTAAMHKQNVDAALARESAQREDRKEAERKAEEARRQAETTERTRYDTLLEIEKKETAKLREELQQARVRAEVQLAEAKRLFDEERKQTAIAAGASSSANVELMKSALERQQQSELQLAKQHTDQMAETRRSHEAELSALRETQRETLERLSTQHQSELAGERARSQALEEASRRREDDLRKERDDARARHIEEVARTRMELRDACDREIKSIERRCEERIADLKSAHELELRSDRRTTEATSRSELALKDARIAALEDRIADMNRKLEEVRAQAEESSDPVRVMERAKQNAEALGYTKDVGGPKTMGEQFVAAAGQGLAQALPQVLPQLAALVTRPAAPAAAAPGAQQPGMLPQRALPAAQQQPQPQQRRRAAGPTWARNGVQYDRSATSQPAATANASPRSIAPQGPLAQAQARTPEPAPAEAALPERSDAPEQSLPAEPTSAVSAPGAEEHQEASPPSGDHQTSEQPLVNRFAADFTMEDVVTSLNLLQERFVSGAEAREVATMFRQSVPELAAKLSKYSLEDARETLRSFPNSAHFPLMRYAGIQWMKEFWAALKA
jgi:hypothetical protein